MIIQYLCIEKIMRLKKLIKQRETENFIFIEAVFATNFWQRGNEARYTIIYHKRENYLHRVVETDSSNLGYVSDVILDAFVETGLNELKFNN